MYTLELDCTEDEFFGMACRAEIQVHKAVAQEHRGKPVGLNLEATRYELDKAKGWMSEEVRREINRRIDAGGEGNKPP